MRGANAFHLELTHVGKAAYTVNRLFTDFLLQQEHVLYVAQCMDGLMTCDIQSFSTVDLSGRWTDDYDRLCAMEPCL